MKKKLLLFVPALALVAFGISVPTSAKIIRRNNALATPVTELTATTFTELKDALMSDGNVKVVVTDHITVTETLTTGVGTYQVITNGNVVLTRGIDFKGDMFLVPQTATLTIGMDGTSNTITIDGNKANVADVDGSIVENWGTLNLLDGVTLTNNESLTSGAAILSEENSSLTIDGATISNNKLGVSGQYSAIYVKAGATLDVDSATITGNETYASGAGLFINADVTANVANVTFTNNNCTNGHGPAMAIKEDATISNITVSNNVGGQAGALWIYNKANVTISDSTFTDNLSRSGGAVRIQDLTTVTFNNCEFDGNGAVEGSTISGGAFYVLTGATLNMNDCLLKNSVVGNYGGAIYAKECTINLSNTDFTANQSKYGSAMALDSVVLTATDCEVYENVLVNTASNVPGAIYIYDNSDVTLTNVVIKDNTGSSQGGGINIAGNSEITLNNCEISGHTVSKTGESSNPYGGGIYINGSTATINNSVIKNNKTTKYGAGIYATGSTIYVNNSSINNNIADSSAGGVFINSGTYYMNGGDVSNNISIMGNGAGIANKGSLYISGGAVFEENTATGTGGAIMNYELTKTVNDIETHTGHAYISVDGATFKNNGGEVTATYNGGDKVVSTDTAGAIYVESGENITIKNATFTGNTASVNGGALYFLLGTGGSTTTGEVSNCIFTGNTAKYGGAAIVSSNSKVTFTNCTSSGNTLTAGETDKRGKDIYLMGETNGNKNAVATLNGGSYENIGVQYGIVRVGGNLTISEFIRTWASIQTAYAYIEVFDIIPNVIRIQPKYATEDIAAGKLLLRVDADAKANVYQLINNVKTEAADGKTGNYYFGFDGTNVLRKACDYFITTPLVCATTCPLGANSGDTVSFTTINGYSVSNVKINGTEITETNGVYTFTMPDEAVELTYDYELLPLDIGVDEDARDYISVASTAKLGEKVTVTPVINDNYRVTNVYYTYNYVKYNLDYDSETNTYSFTMFEGVDLCVEKIELYNVSFVENEYITTNILCDGSVIANAASGEEITLNVVSNSSRYMLDLANSYYVVEGDDTHYDISNLTFTMPNGNVSIVIEVIDIYESYENIVEVYTFDDLVAASKLDKADIIINQDIEITNTITFKNYGKYNILGSGVRTLKRANSFNGTMFIIYDFTELTLGVPNSSDITNTLTIDGNKENVTSKGSIFIVRYNATLNISNYVKIINNKVELNEYYDIYKETTSVAGGAAIYNHNGVVNLNGGEISGHESLNSGGAILNYGTVIINSGKITNNTTTKNGGAIYNYRFLYLNGGEISYNEAESYGGAIYNNNNHYATLEARGGSISNNTAISSGGAVFNSHRAFLFIYDINMVNNISTNGNGGAIYTHGKGIIRGGYFANNTATSKDKSGGAIYLNINTSQTKRFNAGELYLHAAIFENNAAYNGGAIAMYTSTQLFIYEDSDVVFRNNTATKRGGAIYLMSDATIKHSIANIYGGLFENNHAVYGKDFAVQYGVLNIGAKVQLDEVCFVAKPQAKYGYLNFISNIADTFIVVPVGYSESFDTGCTFIRFADGVDANKLLDTVSVKQKAGTTWKFVVDGNNLVLFEKEYTININSPVRAIDIAFNANAGDVVTLSKRNGFNVTNLKVNGVDIVNNRFTMPESDVEITYDYEYINFGIWAETYAEGVIETSKNTARVDDLVIITVVPTAGYYLKALYINGESVEFENNIYAFEISSNVTVTAKFEKIKYSVGINYNYDNKYEIKQLYYGEKLKKITPKRSGYTFAGWYTDVELTQEFDFNSGITGVTQLYAKWVKGN